MPFSVSFRIADDTAAGARDTSTYWAFCVNCPWKRCLPAVRGARSQTEPAGHKYANLRKLCLNSILYHFLDTKTPTLATFLLMAQSALITRNSPDCSPLGRR